MNEHLTNLQKFLSQLTPCYTINEERSAAIDALVKYIKALYGYLSPLEIGQLEKLLYQLFQSIEKQYGF